MIKLIHSAVSIACKRGLNPKTILIDKKSLEEFKEQRAAMPVILFATAPPKEEKEVFDSKMYNILGDNFEVIEIDTEEFTLILK